MSKWSITPVVTSDYTAGIGELVQVDMAGKVAPDVVTIFLPAAAMANAGQSIVIVTVNMGGAEDGSKVRLSASTNIAPAGETYCDSVGEVMQTVTSTGTNWVLTSGR